MSESEYEELKNKIEQLEENYENTKEENETKIEKLEEKLNFLCYFVDNIPENMLKSIIANLDKDQFEHMEDISYGGECYNINRIMSNMSMCVSYDLFSNYIEELDTILNEVVEYMVENDNFVHKENIKIKYNINYINIKYEGCAYNDIILHKKDEVWYLHYLKSRGVYSFYKKEIVKSGDFLQISTEWSNCIKNEEEPVEYYDADEKLLEGIKNIIKKWH